MRDGGSVVDPDAFRAVFAHSADVMKIMIRAMFTESSHTVHMLHVDVSRRQQVQPNGGSDHVNHRPSELHPHTFSGSLDNGQQQQHHHQQHQHHHDHIMRSDARSHASSQHNDISNFEFPPPLSSHPPPPPPQRPPASIFEPAAHRPALAQPADDSHASSPPTANASAIMDEFLRELG